MAKTLHRRKVASQNRKTSTVRVKSTSAPIDSITEVVSHNSVSGNFVANTNNGAHVIKGISFREFLKAYE